MCLQQFPKNTCATSQPKIGHRSGKVRGSRTNVLTTDPRRQQHQKKKQSVDKSMMIQAIITDLRT